MQLLVYTPRTVLELCRWLGMLHLGLDTRDSFCVHPTLFRSLDNGESELPSMDQSHGHTDII